MADAQQVKDWLDGLQRERQAKLSETNGVGDLLSAEQPMAMLLGSLLTGADKATRITSEPYFGSVVSPEVKKSRASALKTVLENSKPKPRVDVIPQDLHNYSPRKELLSELKRKGFATIPDRFYGIPTETTKNFEVLKNGEPHSGLSLYRKDSPTLGADVYARTQTKPMVDYLEAAALKKQQDIHYEQKIQELEKVAKAADRVGDWEKLISTSREMSELARNRNSNVPEFPTNTSKALVDPKVTRAVAEAVAARNPAYLKIGGERIDGIRVGPAGKGANYTEVALPKLSDTKKLSAAQQVEKWLHDKINERALPKTKTAGR